MNIFKKITGIEKLEKEKKAAQEAKLKADQEAQEALQLAEAAKQAADIAKLSPKAQATHLGKPWVDVIKLHVDPTNLRNGFYELDWNEYFVNDLRAAGYGLEGDPEEEIVSRWFRDISLLAAAEEGIDMADRGAGYINVKPITDKLSEIS